MTRPFRGPFGWGDRVQLTDNKGRHVTVSLTPGGEYHSHKGVLKHESLIGVPEGSVVSNTHGVEYLAFRPLLDDFAMSMPRGAAIVYPKDAAHIVTFGDIFPGAVVVEAGIGSGALTLSLLRAVGESGTVTSFERRSEFADIALANMAPCDPKTLTRAARDFAEVNPTFATEAGLAALRWLAAGHGYEITGLDVWAAYHQTLSASTNAGVREETLGRIRACFESPAARNGFAASVLGPSLELG